MVVARASGTLMASSLKQNTFLTLKLCPAGGSPLLSVIQRGSGGEGVPPYCRSPNVPRMDDTGSRGGWGWKHLVGDGSVGYHPTKHAEEQEGWGNDTPSEKYGS